MNDLQELRAHAEALVAAIDQDPKFFASVKYYVHRLRDLVAFPSAQTTQREIALLAGKLEEFWRQWRSTDPLYISPRQTSDTDATVRDVTEIVTRLQSMQKEEFEQLIVGSTSGPAPASGYAVFVGHGRSRLWARLQVFLETELGLQVVTFESESRVGDSIVPILEKMLSEATFAVLVLTAEDETPDGTRRARQNVVHEAGLFQGRLGFKRAVLLVQEGLEEFTNVAGLQHIRFSGDSIEQGFYELQRVLKREGLAR